MSESIITAKFTFVSKFIIAPKSVVKLTVVVFKVMKFVSEFMVFKFVKFKSVEFDVTTIVLHPNLDTTVRIHITTPFPHIIQSAMFLCHRLKTCITIVHNKFRTTSVLNITSSTLKITDILSSRTSSIHIKHTSVIRTAKIQISLILKISIPKDVLCRLKTINITSVRNVNNTKETKKPFSATTLLNGHTKTFIFAKGLDLTVSNVVLVYVQTMFFRLLPTVLIIHKLYTPADTFVCRTNIHVSPSSTPNSWMWIKIILFPNFLIYLWVYDN